MKMQQIISVEADTSVSTEQLLKINKEVKTMARNGALVPQAKQALESLKMEAANSMNVNLKQGYNGELTSREAGSVGGEMVKRMIAYAQQNMQK